MRGKEGERREEKRKGGREVRKGREGRGLKGGNREEGRGEGRKNSNKPRRQTTVLLKFKYKR